MVPRIIFFIFIFIFCIRPNLFSLILTGDYFSKEEIEILNDSVKSVGFDYGYDFDLNLFYVFTNTFNKDDSPDKNKKFSASLEKITKERLIKYYEKLFKLKEITRFKMERFKDKELWKNYTYINKYLLPYLERYFKFFETETFAVNPSYKERIVERKREIVIEAGKYVRDQELTEKIRSMDKKRRRRWNI